jgi:hypothetical protein
VAQARSPAVRDGLDEAGAIRVMLETPSIIRRPVLDTGTRRHVGFSEDRYGHLRIMSDSRIATVALACDLIRRASVTPDDAGCQH